LAILAYTAYYDWFIMTSGIWEELGNAIQDLSVFSTHIQEGCGIYTPSNTARFLSKYGYGYYGYGDSHLVEAIDSIIQCMKMPATVANNLERIYKAEYDRQELDDLFVRLNTELPGIHSVKYLQIGAPNASSAAMVPYVHTPSTFPTFMVKQNLEILSKMSPDDFERFMILSGISSQSMDVPTKTPFYAFPTFPTFPTFLNDIYGVFMDVVPNKWSASFSIQNMLLYTLQDEIRNTLRKMEDMRTNIKRTVEDKITVVGRLITEISVLPRIVYTLWVINTVSFYSVLYLL
jgi:hypothetical protein